MKEKENRFGEKIEKNIRYNKKFDVYFVQFSFKDISQLKSFSTLEEARAYRDAINWEKTRAKIKEDSLIINQREAEDIKRHLNEYLAYPENVLDAIKIPVDDYRIPENFESVFVMCNKREIDFVKEFYRDRKTLQSIGTENNLTRERVRQIIAAALKKVKSYILGYEVRRKKELQEADLADRHAMREELIKAYRETGVITENMEFQFGKLYVDPKFMAIGDLGIEDLDLSIRCFNCLHRAGIYKLSDLISKSESDIRKIKNLGSGCVREIKEKLALFGLELATEENA